VTDYFVLFNEPRRPWLEPEALKATFLALAAEAHPDKQPAADPAEKLKASRRYADLNAAYHCLTEPKLRLLHLLELELGAKPKDVQSIPPNLAGLFTDVAAMCRSAGDFLVEKGKVASPLLQVQWFERAQAWVEQLRTLQTRLAGLYDQLVEELKSLDRLWTSKTQPGGQTALLSRLEELYRLFSYFNRWNSQVQELVVQLSL
jgi:curved DNA-binding protein CbpA